MKNRNKVPVLMAVVIVSKLVGMLREMVLANYFGTTSISDAYIIASTVPTLLFYFIGHAISTSYLPIFNRVRSNGGEEKALGYTNNYLCAVLCLSVILVAVVLLFPGFIIKLFAAGFEGETAALAIHFIRICAPSIFAMSLTALFTGYLHAHDSFLPAAAVSLPRNVIIITSVALAASQGIDWLAYGLLLAHVGEVLLLIPFVLRKGYRFRPTLALRDPDLIQTEKMILPLLVGLSVSQINKIIDRSLASTVTNGGVSSITYASVINVAIQEVLITSLITILFANCAELVAHNREREVKQQLGQTIDLLLTVLIPASVGMFVLARPMILVLLGRGRFDANSAQMTTGAFCCYTVGLLFLAIRDAVVKVFFAYKDTKTTTMTSIAAILLNIVLNLCLYRWIGLNGLAISTSISAIFHSIILYYLLRKRIGDYGLRKSLLILLKTLIGATVMAIVLVIVQSLWFAKGEHPLQQLVLSIPVGMAVYALAELLLKNRAITRYFQKEKDHGAA